MIATAVLDASALIAMLKHEEGREQVVEAILAGAALGTVNLSEVVAVFARSGTAADDFAADIERLGLLIEPFTVADAIRAGELIGVTNDAGLSFGDRACLALAMRLGCPAFTADRAWSDLDLDVEITLVR